jgi:hypothetical protein
MALSTKDVKGSSQNTGLPKTLAPGNHDCILHSITIRPVDWVPGGLQLNLNLEGPDLGAEFQGFYIDKSNEALGRHKGQVAIVQCGEYAFADGTTKSGTIVSRDAEILKFLKDLCVALDIDAWYIAQDGKYDTVEALINGFNTDKPFAGKVMNYCLAGKEYEKDSYINYNLYLPKNSKKGERFGKNVVKFNEADHIKKKKTVAVESFDAPETALDDNSFDLD